MAKHATYAPFPVTANQAPHRVNYLSRALRTLASLLSTMASGSEGPPRPQGISVYMRVKDEKDWVEPAIRSVQGMADEIVVVDNGSVDGTWEVLRDMAGSGAGQIRLWQRPELHHVDLSNFALEKTCFRWVLRWDGDMVAHTDGPHPISELRRRLLTLPPRRHYLIYLRHTNLAGDLGHQDPREQVHIEEYLHTFSPKARFIHPGRFEAVQFPLYYRPLFWYEPYGFHVNIKPARRTLLRYFWEDWMERKDYVRYPTIEDYTAAHLAATFGTTDWEEAQQRCLARVLADFIPYDTTRFGPYPALLQPFLAKPSYRILYDNGRIVGREEGR